MLHSRNMVKRSSSLALRTERICSETPASDKQRPREDEEREDHAAVVPCFSSAVEGGGDEAHADQRHGQEDQAAQDEADGDGLGRERSADQIMHRGPRREDDPGPESELGLGADSACRGRKSSG